MFLKKLSSYFWLLSFYLIFFMTGWTAVTQKITKGSVIRSKFFKTNWREKRVRIFKGWLYARVPFNPIFIIFITLRRRSILDLNFHFQSQTNIFAFFWLLYFHQQLFEFVDSLRKNVLTLRILVVVGTSLLSLLFHGMEELLCLCT